MYLSDSCGGSWSIFFSSVNFLLFIIVTKKKTFIHCIYVNSVDGPLRPLCSGVFNGWSTEAQVWLRDAVYLVPLCPQLTDHLIIFDQDLIQPHYD